MTEQEKRHYEDVIYPQIARRDWEREIYREIDKENQDIINRAPKGRKER